MTHDVTIGVEFEAANVELNGKVYRLQIWDTAGQETFKSITRNYYKNSACALVCYDITNRDSFENIKSWVEECQTHAPKSLVIYLIGNKLDLEENRQVSREEAEEYAKKNDFGYFECSAKTGIGVDSIFHDSASQIALKIEQNLYNLNLESSGIKMGIGAMDVKKQGKISLAKNYNKSTDKKCCK